MLATFKRMEKTVNRHTFYTFHLWVVRMEKVSLFFNKHSWEKFLC